MTNEELRAKILQTLGIAGASKERQENALNKVESIARKRMALAIPELLTDEQVEQVGQLREKGTGEAEIMRYIEQCLPAKYDPLLEATILDVAEEVAELHK